MTTNTADGQPRFVGITQNINERRRAGEALRESEARMRITVEAAAMGTWDWNLVTNEVRWNVQHFLLFGMKLTPDLMVKPADFFAHLYSDDREMIDRRLKQAIAEKTVFDSEFRIVTDSGETRWMSGYGSVVETNANNEATRMSGVMLDITNRKLSEHALRESEERLRLVMESVADYAIITTDTAGIINGWNPGAEKTFGYRAEKVIGQSTEIIFTPEDRKRGVPQEEMRLALETGRAEDERWHIRGDGSRFFVSGVMTLLKNGKVDGFVKIVRDQTQKIEIEKVRRDREILQKLVGAQEDERKRIARDLHDELGQKLTALRLKLEATKKICEKEEICSKIDEMQLIARHIDADVDFLAWELRPAALDDLGLIAALENYVREWSRHSGVTSEFHSTGLKKLRLAPEVETNLYRITQEALNNTHKHAAAKSASVIIEKRDQSVVLIIEDDGIGFDPKNKINRNKGLGLIGMRERAVLVGGTLEIESAPEQGTTIFVRVQSSFINKGKK